MKLLTEKILKKMRKYPLYAQENVPPMEQDVIVKFFNPYGVGTWIITEVEEQDDDLLMYGLANLGYGYEWGYVSFNELNELRIDVFGYKMPIERDRYIGDHCKVKDLVKESEMM